MKVKNRFIITYSQHVYLIYNLTLIFTPQSASVKYTIVGPYIIGYDNRNYYYVLFFVDVLFIH